MMDYIFQYAAGMVNGVSDCIIIESVSPRCLYQIHSAVIRTFFIHPDSRTMADAVQRVMERMTVPLQEMEANGIFSHVWCYGDFP